MPGKSLRRLAGHEPVATHLLSVDLAFDDQFDQVPGRNACNDRSVSRREVFRREVLHRPTIAAVGYESSTLQFRTAARPSCCGLLFSLARDLIEIESDHVRREMMRPNCTGSRQLPDSSGCAAIDFCCVFCRTEISTARF